MKRAAQDKAKEPTLPWTAKVAFGAFAGMVATTAVHPLDVIKVRMQIFPSSCTTLSIGSQLVRCKGAGSLYAGLTAGLMRQATNTTTRLGVYNWIYDTHYRNQGVKPTLEEKVLIGIIAGLAGGFAGIPSEVALVRMMADGPISPCLPCVCPKKYKGAIHAICKICKEEGVGTLWRGGSLTLSRSVFVSAIYLGTNAKAEEMIREHRVVDGRTLHMYTSLITSFFTAVLTLPIDLVKTRYQVRQYVTQKEIFTEILKHKGIRYFWKGFVPYFIRMAIHTITTFLIVEELNELYLKNI